MAARDLFSAIVESVAAADDEADASAARARALDVAHIIDAGVDSAEAVDEMVRLALVAVLQGLDSQLSTVQQTTRDEMRFLRQEDPRKVPAIRKVDVAEARQARAEEKAKAEGVDVGSVVV